MLRTAPDRAGLRPRILLVDDEPVVLHVTAKLLDQSRFEVTSVRSAEEALDRLQLESFDLVVTDFKMRGKTGADVALAARLTSPETPVVLMTGRIDEVPEWMRRGVYALPILLKPFLRVELLWAVNHAKTSGEVLRVNSALTAKEKAVLSPTGPTGASLAPRGK